MKGGNPMERQQRPADRLTVPVVVHAFWQRDPAKFKEAEALTKELRAAIKSGALPSVAGASVEVNKPRRQYVGRGLTTGLDYFVTKQVTTGRKPSESQFTLSDLAKWLVSVGRWLPDARSGLRSLWPEDTEWPDSKPSTAVRRHAGAKTPWEIAALVYPDGAKSLDAPNAERYRQLLASICEALAAGELAPAIEVAKFDQLTDEQREKYQDELPPFNPRVCQDEDGHWFSDPREPMTMRSAAAGEIYSDFNVPIARSAFHLWRASTDLVYLDDNLFATWPKPRKLTKREIVAAVEAAIPKAGTAAKAIELVAKATNLTKAKVKGNYYGTKPKKQKQGGPARAERDAGERRLRLAKS